MQQNDLSLGGIKKRSGIQHLLDPEYLAYQTLAERQRRQKELLQKEMGRSEILIDFSLDFSRPQD